MRYNDTAYFEPSNTLMINYIVTLNSEEVECNEEIDEAEVPMHYTFIKRDTTK